MNSQSETPHYLNRLFNPRSVAVFGASPTRSPGGIVFRNLTECGFRGEAFAINPKYKEVGGRPCFPSLEEVGQPVDLAVIATPAKTVPGLIRSCGERGVRAAIVLSAGFGEGDGAGAGLTRALLAEARRSDVRVLGPNCLGLVNPHIDLNATFSTNSAEPGSLALVSQSGALCTAILDWAEERHIGFSSVVSLGNADDVGLGDVLDYLAIDPRTKSILLYIEGVRHSRRFMSGLRAAARMKPVVVVKAGRHPQGSRAAISHTAALVGGDDAFDAALRRAGVVRAITIEQLFAAAQLLSTHPRAAGNRLAIVTNAGGPGVLATDRTADLKLRVAELSEATLARLDESLPAQWPRSNPVDIIGDAPPERYRAALSACLEDRGVDGVLVMLSPQAMTDPKAAAQAVIEVAQGQSKPVLACWMGGRQVSEGRALLDAAKIPSFPSPETAVEAFAYLANYHENQKMLLEVPGPLSDRSRPDIEGARLIIEEALRSGRTTLSTTESKALLTAFHIPVVPAIRARTAGEALVAGEQVGFPIAMKIDSPDVTHKSDVGGVRLGIASATEIRGAFVEMMDRVRAVQPDAEVDGVTVERMARSSTARELLVGVARDPAFGPVIGFGAGGTAVEITGDRAVALPPLNRFIARDLMRRTRVSALLGKFRELPAAHSEEIEKVLLRVSEMVCELPQIRELDINPLLADERGVLAVDARVVVEHPKVTLQRYAHMAIHPYPTGLETQTQLADGRTIVIRPIRPEDADIEQNFIRRLSSESKYFRFMRSLAELTPEMLIRFTQIDYDREMAFIATTEEDGEEIEIGVVRYVIEAGAESCEFALVVADEWQRKGIGSGLMKTLMGVARDRGLRTMRGEVLQRNAPMLRLMKSLGFTSHAALDDPSIEIVLRDLREEA